MTTTKPSPRPITFDDLEFRVQGTHWKQGNGNAANWVPYLKAHRVAEILDDWVGPGNWADTYEEVVWNRTAVLLCRLSVRIDGEWVTKEDVGVYSNMEAAKGGCSDAFKRVASRKWGVGRQVYDLGGPIKAPCDTYMSKGKELAKANDRTLPALEAELKKRKIEWGGRIDVPETDEDDDAGVNDTLIRAAEQDAAIHRLETDPPLPPTTVPARRVDPAAVDALRERVKALPEDLRVECGPKIRALGDPDQWGPDEIAKAVVTVTQFEDRAAKAPA